MKAIYRMLACAALVAAPILFAETANVIGQNCGIITSNLNCQFVSLDNGGKVHFEPFYNPTALNPGYSVLQFYGSDANYGTAHVTQVLENGTSYSGNKSTAGITLGPQTLGAVGPESTVVVEFTGQTVDTSTPYTGMIMLQVHTYYGYHSGRGASYGNYWVADSGNIDLSLSAQAKNESKPGKVDVSLSWTIHPRKLNAYIPPGCMAPPIESEPVTPPYTCGGGQGVIFTCQEWKSLCITSEEYVFYSWIYWNMLTGYDGN